MGISADMTFREFFFETSPGLLLQALPIALAAGIIFIIVKRKRTPGIGWGETVASSLFVAYLTGLLCLTLFMDFLGSGYYYLIYHQPSGKTFRFFNFSYYFVVEFYRYFGRQDIGNILLFLPFGVLYPLFRRNATFLGTFLAGCAVTISIELIQPVLGRQFDINDILLNAIGAGISAALFFGIRAVVRKLRLLRKK